MTSPEAALRTQIMDRLDEVLTDACFPELPGFSRGKVRDIYDMGDGRRIMVTTDRQSAFDQVLAAVPFKGRVLTSAAMFWFQKTAGIVANHILATPDPNVMVVRTLNMLPIEVVVRDYLTGSTSTSIWPMYNGGARTMYGVTLPDGLKKNDKLPHTILTPTTKAELGGHDRPITPTEIVDKGLLTQEQWDKVSETALALFAKGREIAAQHGLILVDTKYEFGWDSLGNLTLADEIHTPDSSRYWIASTYERRLTEGSEPESLDKEFLRLWIAARCDPYKEQIPTIPADTLADFSARYIALYERVSGETFAMPPKGEDIRGRIYKAIAPYFGVES